MDPVVPSTDPKEPITVTPTEIIYHRRLRALDHAKKTGNVAETCRVFGISRKTFYQWRGVAERYGVEALVPKPRRTPHLPNATPTWVVNELLTLAVTEPTIGCRQYADRLGDRGHAIAKSTVQKVLVDHGMGRRAQRVSRTAAIAAATTGLVTEAGHCCIATSTLRPATLSVMPSRRCPSPVRVPGSAFAGFRFPPDVILRAVRWYLRFALSYRDVEELLTERGIDVDHVTVYRWVRRFTPLLADAARPRRHAVGDRWHVDETYVKVGGSWRYLYRAIDQFGQVVDVLLSTERDARAARGSSRGRSPPPRASRPRWSPTAPGPTWACSTSYFPALSMTSSSTPTTSSRPTTGG